MVSQDLVDFVGRCFYWVFSKYYLPSEFAGIQFLFESSKMFNDMEQEGAHTHTQNG